MESQPQNTEFRINPETFYYALDVQKNCLIGNFSVMYASI